MEITTAEARIDRTGWGVGPWDTEPDRVEWTHAGLPCLAVRNHHGAWCGYAAVPPGHPLHGKGYDNVDVDVHGGLTYSEFCRGEICHVSAPGEPDNVFWFGFDCHHGGDFGPGMHAMFRKHGDPFGQPEYDDAQAATSGQYVDVYRTLDYVQAETNRLADQLAALHA